MMVTTMLFVIVLVLFLWMVRTVIIAAILGVIVAIVHAAAVPAGCSQAHPERDRRRRR